jgi:DNA end-binding protein Ku
VPNAQIDKRYFDAPYYIAPTDKVGQEAFAVIRDTMRGRDMVALGRVVLAKRERMVAIEPYEKGLLATTLRYPYEVRDASAYFEDIADIKVPGEMLKLADHILDSKTGDFEPSTFATITRRPSSSFSGRSRPVFSRRRPHLHQPSTGPSI